MTVNNSFLKSYYYYYFRGRPIKINSLPISLFRSGPKDSNRGTLLGRPSKFHKPGEAVKRSEFEVRLTPLLASRNGPRCLPIGVVKSVIKPFI